MIQLPNKLLEFELGISASTLTKIDLPLFKEKRLTLWLKRDDLIHPVVSGNKWRKLKYNLEHALRLNKDTLISMGGAYSNHLHALGYVGKALDLNTVGIIRGEQPTVLNPTLVDLIDWGMTLHFVNRGDYRQYRSYRRNEDYPELPTNCYWLTEGGANTLALRGVGEIVTEIDIPYDFLCVPCGTGATLAGLVKKLPAQVYALGFPALKNAEYLQNEVTSWLTNFHDNWQMVPDYHFGGFAKVNQTLLSFIQAFEAQTGILLDPVYTGKMLYGIYDLAAADYFPAGSRIVAIHTGGVQGKRGFK